MLPLKKTEEGQKKSPKRQKKSPSTKKYKKEARLSDQDSVVEVQSSSDDESSEESDDGKDDYRYNTYKNKSKEELLTLLKSKDKKIKELEVKLVKASVQQRQTKKQVQKEYQWSGEETNFADSVSQFCKLFLFGRFKFLKEGWNVYQPGTRDSLSSLVKRKVKVPEGADYEDIWDRVIVPTIRLKYINIKCNLNNALTAVYKSEYLFVKHNDLLRVAWSHD